ncbi:protein Smaug isoform X1 [Atheta coriaria]|uniref:protein Smaug isoform X1 n=1 Tax=Dalotia coriaria TaxID=877792 RepID=UPI0031F43BC9
MDPAQMRDYSEFCEQLNDMRLRFQKWDGCEQTVAIYYLMVGLPYGNAKFLHHALDKCVKALTTPEALQLERNANDPAFICSLLSERPQVALSILQSHLPLLRPGNKETSDCYLKTIRKVLSDFITPPTKIYNECVEIMSYVFVHPAFGKEDKKSFKHLLKQVVHRVTPENFVHSPMNESSDESASPKPEVNNRFVSDMQNIQNRLNRRSNSLTPAQTSSHENLSPAPDVWSSQENLHQQSMKPRSYSLSSDKTINLHNTLQSSSSETRLQDLQMMNNQPIMRSIVGWLKSLRLHKYSWVFNNLTYEKMLNLTDDSLDNIGITKGARHKLLLSISKLRERSLVLTMLETEVMNGCELPAALRKLKGVMMSPLLLVAPDEDLPAQFVKVMGKVCTQLLMLRQPSEESLNNFVTLCDRAETNDAFTAEQKRRLTLWRGQVKNSPQNGTTAQNPNNNYRHQNQSYNSTSSTNAKNLQIFNHKSSSYPNVQNQSIIGGHRHSIGSIQLNSMLPNIYKNDLTYIHKPHAHKPATIQSQASNANLNVNISVNTSMPPPSLPLPHHHVRFQETETENDNLRAEMRSDAPLRSKKPLKNVDIESNLESLCLQMMEHALGP